MHTYDHVFNKYLISTIDLYFFFNFINNEQKNRSYSSHKERIVFTERDESMQNTLKNFEGTDGRNFHMLRYGLLHSLNLMINRIAGLMAYKYALHTAVTIKETNAFNNQIGVMWFKHSKWNQVAIVYMGSDHNCITEYLNFLNSMRLENSISHSQYGLAAESCNFVVLKSCNYATILDPCHFFFP